VLGIGQLECVSYRVLCGVFYYVDSEKALINVDDCQERELRIGLGKPSSRCALGIFEKEFKK
jgi:hypothetical protein